MFNIELEVRKLINRHLNNEETTMITSDIFVSDFNLSNEELLELIKSIGCTATLEDLESVENYGDLVILVKTHL